MSTIQRSKAVILFWKIHRWLYKASRGRIGAKLGDSKNLLLTTTGHKSGLPRDIAITYFELDGKIVIIGSNLGYEKHPAWYLNLKANPLVTVRIGTEVTPMNTREAEGEERQRLWNEVIAIASGYAEYEQTTERRIPVVVLEPAHGKEKIN